MGINSLNLSSTVDKWKNRLLTTHHHRQMEELTTATLLGSRMTSNLPKIPLNNSFNVCATKYYGPNLNSIRLIYVHLPCIGVVFRRNYSWDAPTDYLRQL